MENHTPNDEAQQRFFEQVDLWDAEHRNSPEKLERRYEPKCKLPLTSPKTSPQVPRKGSNWRQYSKTRYRYTHAPELEINEKIDKRKKQHKKIMRS